jgi:hypothetical protein
VAVPRLVPAKWKVSGVHRRHSTKKGTTMKKNYQTTTRSAGISGRTTPKKAKADPDRTKYEAAVTLPDAVTVAVGEL